MPKRLLELCCGTGQASRYFQEQGWETTTVDLDPRFNPTILADVRDLDPTRWEPGYNDAVWASPPCVQHSIAVVIVVA